jgi:hypothetical protein
MTCWTPGERIRIAKAVLRRLPARRASIRLPKTDWARLSSAFGRLELARSRGWSAGLEHSAACLRQTADALADRLRGLGMAAGTLAESRPEPNLREIVSDLETLETEFPKVVVDLHRKTLSVVTDDIVLKEVCLGPFEIRLDFDRLQFSCPYAVTALEPNPAAGSSSTTHPHVRNDVLCEGEAKLALQAALRELRLLDFFVVVRQVLENYNPDSAFVSLRNWEGIRCPDCGESLPSDDMSCCEQCDSDVCGSCSCSCLGGQCGRSLCAGCVSRCSDCGDGYCRRCLKTCPDCEEDFCDDCLVNGRCTTCREEPNDEKTLRDDAPETRSADAALHTDGLGQAALPA